MRERARVGRTVLCAALVALAACARASADETTTWVGSEPAPAFEGLGVRSGRPLRLADERGKIVVLSFGYTSCLDVCPDTFLKARALFDGLGERARDVAFVYVTVDPERDTPAALRSFLAAVDPRFEGLYLDGDRLASLLGAYHVTARKRLPDPQGYERRHLDPSAYYTMDHTSGFWVIDRRGSLRIRFGHDTTSNALIDGVGRLLAETTS